MLRSGVNLLKLINPKWRKGKEAIFTIYHPLRHITLARNEQSIPGIAMFMWTLQKSSHTDCVPLLLPHTVARQPAWIVMSNAQCPYWFGAVCSGCLCAGIVTEIDGKIEAGIVARFCSFFENIYTINRFNSLPLGNCSSGRWVRDDR